MIDNALCACGCGEVLYPFDKRGRPKQFITGHSSRIIKYKLIANYIPPENKQCTICLIIKSIEQFYYKTYTSKTTGEKYKRYRSECINCSKEYALVYNENNSELISLKKKEKITVHKNNIRFHVQNKIATWRKASIIPSDLTVDYLVNLYNKQDGYCFYTGEKMLFGWVDGKINHNSLSLDKLDPEKGYVQGNVVWCTYLINTMKQNLNEQQFYNTINNIFNTTYGVSMTIDISIKDKLQKITMISKLGNLPKIIEEECAKEAAKGRYECRLIFNDNHNGIKPFFKALGPANLSIWKNINEPFEKHICSREDFENQVINDLEKETCLKIKIVPQLNSDGTANKEVAMAYTMCSLILDVSWK